MDEKSSSLTSASADILIRYYDVDRDLERESWRMRRQTCRGIEVLAVGVAEGSTLFCADSNHQTVTLLLMETLCI
jgi:hypothetical protein